MKSRRRLMVGGFAAAAAVVAIAVGGLLVATGKATPGGVALSSPSTTPAATPILSPTQTTSPGPSPSPTASPTPPPVGFTQQSDGSITWFDTSGRQRPAPEFNGLVPRLQDGKALYADAKGVAAEFKPNLTISGEQTGVLFVRADIATPLIRAANSGGQLAIPIFLDTRSIDDSKLVAVRFDADGPLSLPRMLVNLPSGADIVEFNPENTGAYVTFGAQTLVNYGIMDPSGIQKPTSQLKPELLTSIFVYGYPPGERGGTLVGVENDVYVDRAIPVGTRIAAASAGDVSIVCMSDDTTVSKVVTANNLLTYQGVPVGVMELAP